MGLTFRARLFGQFTFGREPTICVNRHSLRSPLSTTLIPIAFVAIRDLPFIFKMASREKIPTGAAGRAHEYDRDSGQVFREWSVAQKAPSHTDDWDRMLRFPPSAGYVPSIKGPRSLVEMVTTVVAENLASVEDVAWLQDLPDQVVWLVWHYFDHQLRHVTCCLLLR